ncbi:hypothetical protein AAE250_11600 [Bacteroides sp. GD17]|jgi:hypothetical protein|uniref:hypothetical protein n=1 Tax=Bacteroides sp. GD17 TaxID=3139826 RepID=UPI00206A4547|nr:hypothetical protein [uncultured Bacteroides sp.]DAV44364.1 MAG TPA: hypothetical protein [Caudoviricetes sp.]
MDRKLTDNEKAFLTELRELMAKYSAMLSVEDERISIDVGYSDSEDPVEPIVLPETINTFLDLEDVIELNS